MKFNFEKFGQVSGGEVEIGDLTIVSGPNSTGKTYISYAIHSFLRSFDDLAKIQLSEGQRVGLDQDGQISLSLSSVVDGYKKIYSQASKGFVKNAHSYFSVTSDFFADSSMRVVPSKVPDMQRAVAASFEFSDLSFMKGFKEAGSSELVVSRTSSIRFPSGLLADIVGGWMVRAGLGCDVPRPFAITSERTGVSLFWKDLDVSRNQIFEKMAESKSGDINLMEIAFSHTSRYALPIKENIDSARRYEDLAKGQGFLSEGDECGVMPALSSLLGGDFSHDGKSLNYVFKVKGVRKKKVIPVYVASSAVKSLFLFSVYLKHVAKRGDILIVDEPELNLHPSNQRLMAGLLVRLVNSGVKVFITTHSDFLVREISSRIALGEKRERVAGFLDARGMGDADLLNSAQVKAFTTTGGVISSVSVNEYGIDMDTLNEAIGASSSFYEDALLV